MWGTLRNHNTGSITVGSSPRVWGTRGRTHVKVTLKRFIPTCVGNSTRSPEKTPRRRFIPTCVGNSIASSTYSGTRTVHPHVCGELFGATSEHELLSGSSPRVWGTHKDDRADEGEIGSSPRVWGTRPNDARFRCSDRFIPTCVGNSDIYPAARRQFPVHPHVCGELYRIYRIPRGISQVHPHACGELSPNRSP